MSAKSRGIWERTGVINTAVNGFLMCDHFFGLFCYCCCMKDMYVAIEDVMLAICLRLTSSLVFYTVKCHTRK